MVYLKDPRSHCKKLLKYARINFESTLCDLMKKAFKITVKWCFKHELSINATKTELITFTNRRVPGLFKLAKVFNTELKLKDVVKYLDVILDSKLLWNNHLDYKYDKSTIAFYHAKRCQETNGVSHRK